MSANEQIIEILHEVSKEVAGMRADLNGVKEGQKKLFDIVANGNGQPSLMSQVSTVKSDLSGVRRDMAHCARQCEKRFEVVEKREGSCKQELLNAIRRVEGVPPIALATSAGETEEPERKSRWAFYAVIVTTIGGIITAAIAAFIAS